MLNALEAVLGVLLRPRVRRVRRWSFLVTVPLGVLLARTLHVDLGHGALLGALVALAELALVAAVATAGARVLGDERRDALLDLLMHPTVRRLVAGEARMLLTLPTALAQRVRPPAGRTFGYHRGTHELGLALALVPATVAEAGIVHLLLPDGWVTAHVVLAALHLYGIVVLLSWALGDRAHPHRLDGGVLRVRRGTLHRADVPVAAIAAVERRTERAGQRSGLLVDGDAARLAVGGRTDLVLALSRPVRVARPVGAPVHETPLAIRADDADALAAALRDAPAALAASAATTERGAALLAPADLLGALAAS